MATQNRFFVLLLNDPQGARALGPYTKHQARIVQIANVGSRVVTATQLAALRASARAHKARVEVRDADAH